MKINPVYILGGLAGIWYLTKSNNTPPSNTVPGSSPTSSGSVPTTYGVNGGYVGNHAATVANYAALIAANPNLSNPYYQLTSAEQAQYVKNYSDIQEGVATWPGGLSPANIQKHWTLYGAPQQRIFLPLVPVSSAQYIAPVVQNSNSSGGSNSWISSAISVAGSVAVALLGPEEKLNNAEVQMVLTGGLIINDLLPIFKQQNFAKVNFIEGKMKSIINEYAT